jgi:hypothetical protein
LTGTRHATPGSVFTRRRQARPARSVCAPMRPAMPMSARAWAAGDPDEAIRVLDMSPEPGTVSSAHCPLKQ